LCIKLVNYWDKYVIQLAQLRYLNENVYMFTNETYYRIIVNRNYNNTDVKDSNEIYTVVTQITTYVV